MRRLAACAALALAACAQADIYLHQTAGISPAKLLPLYLQEKQYVEDRKLAAAVRGALAARGMRDVEVDVYLKEVTLRGDPRALAVAREVHGVERVRRQGP